MTEAALVIFTALLVVVGFLQWLVLRGQRKVMSGQLTTMNGQLEEMAVTREKLSLLVTQAAQNAAAGQDSALAAKRNTDAFVSSERAWVIPELHSNVFQGADKRWYHISGRPLTTEEVLAGKHLLYRLKLTKHGQKSSANHGVSNRL